MIKNSKFNTISAKRASYVALLCSLSLISFMLESLLPPLFLPGAKIGLSNIFTLLTLILFSPTEAILLVVIRTTLGCIIVGNISALIYSLSAGLVSVIVSSIALYTIYPKTSIISISVLSAVIHNIVQTLIFCLITQSINMVYYLPYFALIGCFSGLVVGFIVYLVIHKLPFSFFEKLLNTKTNTQKECV